MKRVTLKHRDDRVEILAPGGTVLLELSVADDSDKFVVDDYATGRIWPVERDDE